MEPTDAFAAKLPFRKSWPWRWPMASVRTYLVTIIMLATVPLAGLTSWMIFQEGKAGRKQFDIGLQRATASFALTVEREVASSVDALTILSYSSLVRSNDVFGFFQAMVELPRRPPAWSATYLMDLEGSVLFSTARAADGVGKKAPAGSRPAAADAGSPGPRNSGSAHQLADLASGAAFQQVKKTLRPAVSDVWIDDRGNAAIGVQVPVIVDGALRYVLGATIDAANWQALFASASLLPDGGVLLIDANGHVIARTGHPAPGPPASTAGARIQVSDAARVALSEPVPPVRKTTLFDAEPSYVAWHRVGETGWTLGMDIPAAPLDDAAALALRTALVAGLLSLAAGVALALLLARHLTLPLRQLALSGPRAVIGPVEVREIALLREALASAEAQRLLAQERIAADIAEHDASAAREQAARHEAETANRVKDEFMAMLSHELRNPLSAISSAAELLNRMGLKEPVAQNAVRIIGRQTRHLARLMEDLLDVARVIAGKILLSRAPLNLAAVVQRLMSTLEMTGATREHRVTVTVDDVWINADVTRIEQVANNLVTNALKYTPGGGHVSVAVRAELDAAVLEVRDNGVGIAPSLLPKLFDLFVQGDRALDRRQGGLGIGLTLVRRLVETHGGTVGAASPAVGSVFTVRLPRVEAPMQEPVSEPVSAAPPVATPKRVLVIEDNDDASQVLRALLELSGHHVLSASDGTSGLQMLIDNRCEVALIDIGLPGLNGLEVAERARAAGVTCKLIALTGYGQAKDLERTSAAGFDAHLTKPIDPRTLQSLLA